MCIRDSEYAGRAGYSVGEAAAFFDSLSRLSDRSGQQIPSWMSSHPDPGERSQTILQFGREQASSGVVGIVEQSRYYDMVNGMAVGVDPRQGFTEGNVFYHPALGFSFAVPSGWVLQNEANSVMMADEGRKALMAFSFSSASSPESAAHAFASELQGVEVSRSSQRINGLEAFVVELEVPKEEAPMMVHYTCVAYRDQVYSFMGYCSSADYESYRLSFGSIGNSFEQVKDSAILNRQPVLLSIGPARRTAKFSELLPDSLPDGLDALSLAIMNQLNLDTVVERGQLLKLPAE